MPATPNMYPDVKTWNPFKGCNFDCTYCVPSFKKQALRQKKNCMRCYRYEPHEHPKRLPRSPGKDDLIFACGDSDISFCAPSFVQQIIEAIRTRPEKTYYLQSKKPACFEPFLKLLPKNVILLTTLETNRDEGYKKVSKRSFTKAQVEELDEQQKKDAVESAEGLIEKLKDLVIKLKKA